MASNVAIIYAGRFHPFHKGHKAVYDSLVSKFGVDKVSICTSNKTGPGSPFTFKEKRAMMMLTGVPGKAIKEETSPYKPANTLSAVSPDTAVMFAIGQKDMDENPRFKPGLKKDGSPTYYQPLGNGNISDLEGYEKHGYLIVAPTVKFTVLGEPASSATQLRAQYKTLDDDQRKEFIKDLFGTYNEVIQQVLDTRLAETTTEGESVDEGDSYTATIDKGDEVKVGRFKNRKATVKGITKDEHGQPVLKTNKGDHKLFKPRITKLENSLKVIEDSYWQLLKRKLDPKVHGQRYSKAAERLHSVLQRKKKENAGKPFRHALGYYAMNIANSFKGIDSKTLLTYYLDNFDPVMREELVTPNGEETSSNDGAVTSKLSGGVSPQMIAKQLPGVKDKQQLLQVLMKMKRGDDKYSRNQMIAAADAFKELIAKDPQETQKIMTLLKRVKSESTYQFEDVNFDTVQENFADGKVNENDVSLGKYLYHVTHISGLTGMLKDGHVNYQGPAPHHFASYLSMTSDPKYVVDGTKAAEAQIVLDTNKVSKMATFEKHKEDWESRPGVGDWAKGDDPDYESEYRVEEIIPWDYVVAVKILKSKVTPEIVELAKKRGVKLIGKDNDVTENFADGKEKE